MRTYPLHNDGRQTAFEIENIYISVRKAEELLSTVPGVTEVVRRKPFSDFDDVHIRFKYQGVPFEVLEPFGDNSRYLIGPAEPSASDPNPQALLAVFDNYRPNVLVEFIGDLVSLNFFRRR